MAQFGGQMEIVNISKIRDGLFIGDASAASNLEVILTFKISHIINASPSQVMNSYENLTIKYLSINWSENINQNLFDIRDEIANKIISFIDDATMNGDGLLVNSFKGQNRACVVVIIYLMKKYRWTLSKALDLLNSKKLDVNIMKQFLTQLSLFEARLTRNGLAPKSSEWTDNNCIDGEETIMRNTYVNGLLSKQENQTSKIKSGYNNKKVKWIDNNSNRKEILEFTNYGRDLLVQKEIKPITVHRKGVPIKSSLKSRSNSFDPIQNNSLREEFKSNNFININSSQTLNNNRQNNFKVNQNPLSASQQQRPYSVDQKSNSSNEINKNIQIITPTVNQIFNNNINNIIISPHFKNYEQIGNEVGMVNINTHKNLNDNNFNQLNHQMLNQNRNNYSTKSNTYDRYGSVKQRDNNKPNFIEPYSNKNYNPIGINNHNDRESEREREMFQRNNFIQEQRNFGEIQNSNIQIPSISNSMNFPKSSSLPNNLIVRNTAGVVKPISNNRQFVENTNKSNFLRDYQTEGKKQSSMSSGGINMIKVKSKQAPVRIQNEVGDYYSNNSNNINGNIQQIKKQNQFIAQPSQYGNFNNQQQNNSLRNNSKQRKNDVGDRPSTAPSKNDIKAQVANISISNSMKRLNTPQTKSNNLGNVNPLNQKTNLSSSQKYRSQSPMTMNNNKNFGMNSFKGVPNKNK